MAVFSFDIFDTCLIRTCGDAKFVFDILAEKMLPNAEMSLRMDFALERQNAERIARSKFLKSGKEDVTLEEIYSCFNLSGFDVDYSVEDIAREEICIEEELLVPVMEFRNTISGLRKDGNNILFISDMYLPHDFLKRKLEITGFLKEGDELYVSCEIGKSKASGNLFKYVQNVLDIEFCQWTHYGDNIHSDYNMPKLLGIKTVLVNHQYSYYEKLVGKRDYTSREMVGHIMGGISRSVRLANENTPYNKFAADFVAPIYVPFVTKVLNDAKKRGIKDLYFLARDAYIFYEIAKILTPDRDSIGLHYLYVSRSSLYLPGLKEISEESLLALFTDIDWQSPESILTRLHMDDYKLQVNVDGLYGAKKIIPLLFQDSAFVKALEEKHAEQSLLCLKYFKENGLGETDTSAIVDLTGTRRCHNAINNILTSGGLNTVFGYYFEVLPQRKSGVDYYSLNFSERYQTGSKTYCVAPHDVFEQYYSITSQNRTKEYKQGINGVEPVFESDSVCDSYKSCIAETNISICKQYARAFMYMLGNADVEHCCSLAVSVSTDFYYYPKKEYIMALKDLVLSDSSVERRMLLNKQSILKLIKNRAYSPWFYGNLIYNSWVPELWRCLLRYLDNRS